MEITRDFLLPNVRVRSSDGQETHGGSGTIIYSRENKDGAFSTYLLTNHHVVENNIKVDKKWSTLLKRDVKVDVLGIVNVEFFKYQWESRAIGSTAIEADIATYDPDEDLALLKLRDEDAAPAVAKLYPRGKENKLRLGMPVLAVGAALGNPPIITEGLLSQFGKEIENREFWISTAPTIFGNSGGAVYLKDTGEFIGVPARIAVMLAGLGIDAITHLSYAIPVTRVYNFLENQLFRFVYDDKYTEEGEAKERERQRKEEERKIAAVEEQGAEEETED